MSDANGVLQTTTLAPTEADATYRKVMWRLMPFLIVCYIVAFIDRTNVGVAKLGFSRDLGFSEQVYGLGGGLFYLGYILLEIPSNLYLAKVGVRRTLLRIMVLWGLCSTVLAWMTTPWHYYLLRFLLGAAEAGLFPGILLYLTLWTPVRRRAAFTALFMTAIPIAGMLGGPVGGAIMHAFDGFMGMKGWQWLFIVEGLPAVFLAFVGFFFLSDRPDQCRWLSPEQKAQIAADVAADHRGLDTAARSRFADVLKDSRFYCVAALGCAIMVSTAGLFLWLPTIVRESGVKDVLHIGLLSGAPFIVGFVAQFWVARRSDRLNERRWHAIVPALVAAVGWGGLPFFSHDTTASMLLLTLATAGTLGATGPFWTLPTRFLSPTVAAAGLAFITTLAGVGNFFSPILVGWLATETGSLHAGQAYFAAMLVLGCLLVAIGTRPAARETS